MTTNTPDVQSMIDAARLVRVREKWTRPTLTVEVIKITPEIAAELLLLSRGNRKIREDKVRKYTETFRNRTHAVFSGPVISRTARLLDWHHRLTGLIRSGETIWAPVTMGADDRALEFIDGSEGTRSGGDKLDFEGEKNTHALSSALSVVHSYLSGQMARGRIGSPDELVATLQQHPAIRSSVQFCRVGGEPRITHTGDIIGFHYLFSTVNPDASDSFVNALRSGADLGAGSPVLLLRNRLISEKEKRTGKRSRLSSYFRAAMIIKSWEYFRRGESMRQLKWDEREPFPRITGVSVTW